MVKIALIIPKAEQTLNGAALDPKSPYNVLSGPTVSVLDFHGLTGLGKAICKSRPGYS